MHKGRITPYLRPHRVTSTLSYANAPAATVMETNKLTIEKKVKATRNILGRPGNTGADPESCRRALSACNDLFAGGCAAESGVDHSDETNFSSAAQIDAYTHHNLRR
ncbi:hypothetical protein EVAR_92915_1 [Eumeta japonica]|uniref:Uncharacterized protein n=1 Tax=Eumeta variegata TaxID=151549 RepID=A0A4C1TB83_EUMVA|nr:hypothetical protein EVAR_92915_1 [Eumeta japonica]